MTHRFVAHARMALLAMLTLGLLFAVRPAPTNAAAPTQLQFRDAMRKLWEDHITWTRLYIISAAADLPDKDAAAQRLLQNQTDIGNAIRPYYGDAAGVQLTALLKDHILGAADLLAAANAGDASRVDAASMKWDASADESAAFV